MDCSPHAELSLPRPYAIFTRPSCRPRVILETTQRGDGGIVTVCLFNSSAVDCGPLTDASSNGAVDTSSGTTFMMSATYTCNTGYNRTGAPSNRTCQASGNWSLTAPTCDRECFKSKVK